MSAPRTGLSAHASRFTSGLQVGVAANSNSKDGMPPLEGMSERQSQEWSALLGERDPELFAQAALSFAASEEVQAPQLSAQIYSFLQDFTGSSVVSQRARNRLEVLQGAGPSGERLEYSLRNFAREATNPASLGAMILASFAFQGVRVATLSRLLSSPTGGGLTRGSGAAAAAYGAGFAAEVPVFVFAQRGLHAAFELGASEAARPVSEDLRHAALQLSLLKGMGAISGRVSRSPLATQAGMFGGILMGQAAEISFGWSAPKSASDMTVDALTTLLHLNVGGRLSQVLLGPRVAAWTRDLEQRARLQGPPQLHLASLQLAGAVAGPSLRPLSRGSEELPQPLYNFKFDEDSSSDLKTVTRRFGEGLGKNLKQDPEASPLRKVRENLSLTPESTREVYAELLLKVSEKEMATSASDAVATMLLGASSVFAYVSILNPLRRVRGSFYDSLVQEAFERSLAERQPEALGDLVRVVTQNPTLESMEVFFKRRHWHGRYGMEVLSSASALNPPARMQTAIDALPLGATSQNNPVGNLSRRMLTDYLKAYHANKIPSELRHPAKNYLIAQEAQGLVRHPMDLPLLARGIAGMDRLLKSDEGWLPVVSAVTTRALKSPVPVLFMDRLFKLLATQGMPEKLGDLAYAESFDLARVRGQFQGEVSRRDWRGAGEKLNRGYQTGFVDDAAFSMKLARFYQDLPSLLNPVEAARRRQVFHERAFDLLKQRSESARMMELGNAHQNYHAMDIVELLEIQSTPLSRKARAAFLRSEVDLQLLTRQEMQELWSRQEQSAVSKIPALSLFIPQSKSATGRPTVALTRASAFLNPEERARQALRLASWAVHEFEHYMHHQTLPFQVPAGLLRAEMRASLEELFFLVQNGELAEWNRIRPMASQGLGIYLRSRVEEDYLGEPRLTELP